MTVGSLKKIFPTDHSFFVYIEKFSLITSEECIESNIIPIEALKFLEEETPVEIANNAVTTNDQDGEDEDLVCRQNRKKTKFNRDFLFSSLILFKSTTHIHRI